MYCGITLWAYLSEPHVKDGHKSTVAEKVTADPIPPKIRSGPDQICWRFRSYLSGFDLGYQRSRTVPLSICHSKLCYISQYSCSSDLAKSKLLVYKYYIFVGVFLDSGSEYDYNLTRNNEYPCQNKTTVWSETNTYLQFYSMIV